MHINVFNMGWRKTLIHFHGAFVSPHVHEAHQKASIFSLCLNKRHGLNIPHLIKQPQ